MNKSYRSIWNEKVGTFVAVAETAVARGKKNSGGAVCDPEGGREAPDVCVHQGRDVSPKIALRAAAGVGASVALLFGGSGAWAQSSAMTCSAGSSYGYDSTGATISGGGCANPITGAANWTGVVLNSGSGQYLTFGMDGFRVQASGGLFFSGQTDFTGNLATNVADGSLAANSKDEFAVGLDLDGHELAVGWREHALRWRELAVHGPERAVRLDLDGGEFAVHGPGQRGDV